MSRRSRRAFLRVIGAAAALVAGVGAGVDRTLAVPGGVGAARPYRTTETVRIGSFDGTTIGASLSEPAADGRRG